MAATYLFFGALICYLNGVSVHGSQTNLVRNQRRAITSFAGPGKDSKYAESVVLLKDKDGDPDCTGFVIEHSNPNSKEYFIISAAHCFWNREATPPNWYGDGPWTAHFAKDLAAGNNDGIKVTHIAIDERFTRATTNKKSRPYDIAVLTMDPSKHIVPSSPFKLPTQITAPQRGHKFIHLGYGSTTTLHEFTTDFDEIVQQTQNKMGGAARRHNGVSNGGDSGGPVMTPNGELIGITSAGNDQKGNTKVTWITPEIKSRLEQMMTTQGGHQILHKNVFPARLDYGYNELGDYDEFDDYNDYDLYDEEALEYYYGDDNAEYDDGDYEESLFETALVNLMKAKQQFNVASRLLARERRMKAPSHEYQ